MKFNLKKLVKTIQTREKCENLPKKLSLPKLHQNSSPYLKSPQFGNNLEMVKYTPLDGGGGTL